MNAIVYARFSTDKQSDSSIDDQTRICRARADALELNVVAVHADRAVSGASCVQDRPGGRAMLADALAGRFSVLFVESLDRLSRDQVEQETIVRRLEHRGIRIIGVSDSYDTASGDSRKLLRGVRGMINETYLDDLRKKTHRGLIGQISRGFHAGGLSFGYRSVVAGVNARGEPIGHRLEIDQAQAEIVRQIFARYSGGESCQRIAAELNARGIRGPRGGTWSVSALYGSPAKGSGVLNNELYRGRYIWNRSRWVKDPDTRQRQRIARPCDEWQIEKRPELRIIDDAGWNAARVRMDSPRHAGGRRGRGGIPTTLFGGLLRCGICGGAVIAASARDYACATRKDRGVAVCAGIAARREEVDRVLIEHLQHEVLAPTMLAEIERTAIQRALEFARASRDADHSARITELRREIERLADGIATVGVSPALADRLRRAEADLEALNRLRTRADVTMLPAAIRIRARALANDLRGVLQRETSLAREALRATFGSIRLVPDEGAIYAEFDDAAENLLLAVGGASLGRVAGAGFEPATFGL